MFFIRYALTCFVEFLFFREEIKIAKRASRSLFVSNLEKCKPFSQGERLVSLIENASVNSRFYKDTLTSNNLLCCPVVSKPDYQANIYQFVNETFSRCKQFVFTTGGSTGEPFSFRVTRLNGFVDRYHGFYFYKKIGFRKGDRVFSFDGVHIEQSKKEKGIYWKRTKYQEYPYGSVHFSAIDLNKDTFRNYLDELNKQKPAFIRSYPSAIVELAQLIQEYGCEVLFSLKGIVLSSENIYQWHIDLLNKVFKAPVYGQYGHSEMCVFAFTEANSMMYRCSPFYGYTEVLDENNNPVKVGEVGRIVGTSFYNRAMYFIRYNTGDLAEYGGVDDCGFVIFNRIVGREQEFVYNKEKQAVNITALIFGSHYKAFEHIKKWQIAQREYGLVMFFIIKNPAYSISDESEIMDSFGAMGIACEFRYVDDIPLTPRGKYRLVINEIEKSDG